METNSSGAPESSLHTPVVSPPPPLAATDLCLVPDALQSSERSTPGPRAMAGLRNGHRSCIRAAFTASTRAGFQKRQRNRLHRLKVPLPSWRGRDTVGRAEGAGGQGRLGPTPERAGALAGPHPLLGISFLCGSWCHLLSFFLFPCRLAMFKFLSFESLSFDEEQELLFLVAWC